MSAAGVPRIPKHHMWIHMALRSKDLGNPRQYSTFLDESSNKMPAAMAVVSTRHRWEERAFVRARLLPLVGKETYFASS
eukprot:8673658-Pyramimonas_sp.AAC.1